MGKYNPQAILIALVAGVCLAHAPASAKTITLTVGARQASMEVPDSLCELPLDSVYLPHLQAIPITFLAAFSECPSSPDDIVLIVYSAYPYMMGPVPRWVVRAIGDQKQPALDEATKSANNAYNGTAVVEWMRSIPGIMRPVSYALKVKRTGDGNNLAVINSIGWADGVMFYVAGVAPYDGDSPFSNIGEMVEGVVRSIQSTYPPYLPD